MFHRIQWGVRWRQWKTILASTMRLLSWGRYRTGHRNSPWFCYFFVMWLGTERTWFAIFNRMDRCNIWVKTRILRSVGAIATDRFAFDYTAIRFIKESWWNFQNFIFLVLMNSQPVMTAIWLVLGKIILFFLFNPLTVRPLFKKSIFTGVNSNCEMRLLAIGSS